MGILVKAGKAALAQGIKSQSIYLGWGTGDPAWDTTPVAESIDAAGLMTPIGFKKCARALYVEKDPNGQIPLSNGTWRISDTPTGNLYLEFIFDYTDGGDAQIREVGIFINCQVKDEVTEREPDKTYFTTADLDNSGTLLAIEHLDKTQNLSPYVRGSYETVLEF